MKILRKRLCAASIIIAILMVSTFGFAATVNVPATATVTAATLTLTQVTDLNFGNIISTAAVSTITIDATAGAATPAVTSGSASVSGGTSGLVTVGTNINANVTISFAITGADTGTTAQAIGISGAATTMAITNASISTHSTPSPLAVTVAGPNSIHIGGVLTVGASQAAGTYTGTCVATVIY